MSRLMYELSEKEAKHMEADDQEIQTILMGLQEYIYVAVDSFDTTQEIWLRVQQMMKGFDIGLQEKEAKLFNEWENFKSIEGESIESYYHHFTKLMNDFKRNKHFPKNIASNLKFLNNLQLEWKKHVIIVHQTKDLHEVDYIKLYDFLKFNQAEIQMVEGNGGNQFRLYVGQIAGNQIRESGCSESGYSDVGIQNGLIVVPGIANQNANQNENGNVIAAQAEGNGNGNNDNQIRRDAAYLQTQLLIAQKEEAGIQLQAEEFDLMAATGDIDETEEVNTNCILMANLQQASTSAAKFVGDFKTIGKEADESFDMNKVLEYENERLLRAVVSQDIMSIVQNNYVVDTVDKNNV
ncbi:hypothetical protein Tco_0566141 [Tanacetum coccineum]